MAGAGLRWGAGELIEPWNGFPVATLIVNLVGAALLGAVVVLARDADGRPTRLQLLLGVGFCGALTTMSAFVNETVALVRLDRWPMATSYVVVTIVGGLTVVAATVHLLEARRTP